MAINKKLIHFKNFSDFNSKKLSANENNTQYTLGINGTVTNGSPDILYQSICYIKDTKQQWTHGQLYDGSKSDTTLNETDPVFSASPAANITEEQIKTWDDTHEFVQDLDGDISKLYTALRDKQDTISDLATIREGASKGINALQTYIVDFDILELESGEDILDIRTDLLIEAINTHKLILIPFDKEDPLRGYLPVTAYYEDMVYFSITNGVLHIDVNIRLSDNKIYASDIRFFNLSDIERQIDDKMDKVTLATVATSGNYNDLTNKPIIPAPITESTVSGWGFTKNTGTITGVSANGTSVATSGVANIPAATTSVYGVTKLSSSTSSTSTTEAATPSAVKAAYDLADSYKGTVTGVKINGTTKNPSSGIVDLGTVITTHQILKTINGESILGSGDITISGGGSSSVGEDIRYFTEFTVEDFIEACESGSIITYDTTELFNAMKNNKVICVPYRGHDKGFIVASYKSGENEEYPSMYLQKGDVEYWAWTGDNHELSSEYPTYNSTQVVEIPGREVAFEVLDNHIYRMTEPVNYLMPVPSYIQKGATIHFMSGEDGTTIETYGVFWANGEIPQIEPNTYYELSIILNAFYEYNVILTPFKLAE